MREEIWKAVPGYEGRYEASTLGRLTSMARTALRSDGDRISYDKKILSGYMNGSGYWCYKMSNDNSSVTMTRARVMAMTFIGPVDGMVVNHRDGCRLNDTIENIEICTQSQNLLHARDVLNVSCGEKRYNAKLKESQIMVIVAFSALGFSANSIARHFGVGGESVRRILNGERWRHMRLVTKRTAPRYASASSAPSTPATA